MSTLPFADQFFEVYQGLDEAKRQLVRRACVGIFHQELSEYLAQRLERIGPQLDEAAHEFPPLAERIQTVLTDFIEQGDDLDGIIGRLIELFDSRRNILNLGDVFAAYAETIDPVAEPTDGREQRPAQERSAALQLFHEQLQAAFPLQAGRYRRAIDSRRGERRHHLIQAGARSESRFIRS